MWVSLVLFHRLFTKTKEFLSRSKKHLLLCAAALLACLPSVMPHSHVTDRPAAQRQRRKKTPANAWRSPDLRLPVYRLRATERLPVKELTRRELETKRTFKPNLDINIIWFHSPERHLFSHQADREGVTWERLISTQISAAPISYGKCSPQFRRMTTNTTPKESGWQNSCSKDARRNIKQKMV
jgi:hypothetical protein